MLVGCTKQSPSLQGFDHEKWKADKFGCKGDRKQTLSALENQRDKLLGFEELEIVGFLGRPDQNELSKRNQKFYFYFIDPSEDCNVKVDSASKKLTIRFNAMGLSKEVLIE